MSQTTSTAILLFSRTPQEEARSKRIVSRHKTVAITQVLQAHGLRQARKTGLPILVSTGADQYGQTFGERLASAVENAFAQGYEHLLVMGNDSPDLSSTDLHFAQQQLSNQRLVIGPATDGGTYLLGFSRSAYRRDLFINLAWGTANLQTTFAAYAKACDLDICRLTPLADIDNTQDFWSFIRSLAADSTWLVIFKIILQSTRVSWLPTSTHLPALANYFGTRSLRAPPSL